MLDRAWGGASRREGRKSFRTNCQPLVEPLEGRRLLNASLAPISPVTVTQFLGTQVPLDGSASNAASQTFKVTSSNPDIQATVAQGQFWTINVQHASSGSGDISIGEPNPAPITVQLFQDLTPNTISILTPIISNGFYNGKTFFRVANGFPDVNGFIIQGGSSNNTASGPNTQPGTPFGNELVQQLVFSNAGQVALANTGQPNSNGTQFFFTTAAAANLDYNYTIFGQVVAGQNTVKQMSQVTTTNNTATSPFIDATPKSPITTTSTSLSNTSPDGALHINASHAQAGETSTITVTATDPVTNTTSSQSFLVTVAPNNSPPSNFNLAPVAYPSTVQFTPNTAKSVQLDAVNPNATSSNNRSLTYTISTQPTHGTISQFNSSTGSLIYTPNAGFNGTDSFQFTVTDVGTGAPTPPAVSTPATVTLSTSVANLPIANPGSASTNLGAPVTIQLTGSNNNPNVPQAIKYGIVTQPTEGTISQFNANAGTLVYTPNSSATVGTDSFQFAVTTVGSPNPGLVSSPATITVHLTSPPAPLANPVTQSVTAGTPTTIQLLGNNNNPGSKQAITYTITSEPTKGTLSGFNASTGTVVYTAPATATGTDTFQYQVTNSGAPAPGLVSQTGTVTLNLVSAPINTGAVRVIDNVLVVTPVPRTDKGTNTILVAQVNNPTNAANDKLEVVVNNQVDIAQPLVSAISQIVVFGSKANDDITIDPSVDPGILVTLDGGRGGTNTIQAAAGMTVEHGWFGRNFLHGGDGPNALIGAQGHVRFLPTSSTSVIFAGVPHPGVRRNKKTPKAPGGTFYKFVNGRLVPTTPAETGAVQSSTTRTEAAAARSTEAATRAAKAEAARAAAAAKAQKQPKSSY
jgi:cyclophilin family peptidyl-prolyl cis-trans isomerase